MSPIYRYGWPFGRYMARLGFPTQIRIDVVRDSQAGVFVGTSSDMPGLVVEADSLEELLAEARSLMPMLACHPDDLDRSVADLHLRQQIAHA